MLFFQIITGVDVLMSSSVHASVSQFTFFFSFYICFYLILFTCVPGDYFLYIYTKLFLILLHQFFYNIIKLKLFKHVLFILFNVNMFNPFVKNKTCLTFNRITTFNLIELKLIFFSFNSKTKLIHNRCSELFNELGFFYGASCQSLLQFVSNTLPYQFNLLNITLSLP